MSALRATRRHIRCTAMQVTDDNLADVAAWVTLPAVIVLGLTKSLIDVTRIAIVSWLAAAALNAWAVIATDNWAARAVCGGLFMVCLLAAWGGWLLRQETKRLQTNLLRQIIGPIDTIRRAMDGEL
jgi:hypothetical protein